MIELPIKPGIFAIIDDDDAHLAAWKWSADTSRSGKVYAHRKATALGRQWYVSLHRSVIGPMPSGWVVDHIDGNSLDCRRHNLRGVPRLINNLNVSGPRSDNKTSPFRGVSYNARDRVFRAQIQTGGRNKYLGSFATAEEANVVRLAAEKELWGIQPLRIEAHRSKK